PVEAALIEAERLARGTAPEPGDPKASIERLRQAVSENDFDQRVVSALVRRLLDRGDQEEARIELARGLERNPDSSVLQRLDRVVSAEDPTDALLALIEESDRTPLQKAMTRYEILLNNGRIAEAETALEEAEAADPNDPQVIELAFVRAVARGDRERAADLAKRATDTNSDTVDGLTYRARLQMIDGNTEEAVALLEQALEADSNNPIAWRLLGRTHLIANRANDALSAFQRALGIRPDDIGTATELVRTLVNLGRTEEALTVAREREPFGRTSPSFVQLWLGLEASVGDRELARDRREQLLDLYPEDRSNRASLARIYMDLGQWDDARRMITDLREEADAVGLVGLEAEWHAAQNDMQAAQNAYAEYIIDQDPSTLDSRPFLAMGRFLLSRNMSNQGLAALRQAQQYQDPEFREADRALGAAFMEQNRFADAIEPLRAVIDAPGDADKTDARRRLAEAYLRANQLDAAASELDALSQDDPRNVTNLMLQAEVARLQEKLREAEELLNQAVTIQPENPVIFVQRAQVLAEQPGRRQDAYADLDEALRIRPGYSDALQYMAQLLYADGREDDAIERLKEAVAANPGMTDLTYRLVNELLRQNRSGEAMQTAERSIELRPRDLQRKLTFARLFQQVSDWERSSELLSLAWDQSGQVMVGRAYVDSLLTQKPPRAREARRVLGELAEMTDITQDARMLSQRAMAFRQLGNREQAATDAQSAFDLVWESADTNPRALIVWLGWTTQIFEDPDPDDLIDFLSKMEEGRRDRNPRQGAWIRLLRGRALVSREDRRSTGIDLLSGLVSEDVDPTVTLVANRSLAGAYYEAKDYEAAVDRWRQVLQTNPSDWESANNMAFVLTAYLDRHEEAAESAEMALNLQPENPQVQDTLALVRIHQGQFEEADRLLARALASSQQAPITRLTALIHRGRAKLGMGEVDNARRMAQDAEALLQNFESAPSSLTDQLETLKREIDSR
ncbi:MAG: tetratricopeptide repeat protein, partial [Planctomycetota bacterium]